MHRKDMIQMIVTIVVLLGLFVAYQSFSSDPKPVVKKTNKASVPANTPDNTGDNKPDTPENPADPKPEPAVKIEAGFEELPRKNAVTHSLKNERMTVVFSERGGTIQSATYINADGEIVYYRTPNDPTQEPSKVLEIITGGLDIEPLALQFDSKDNLRNASRWSVEKKSKQSITFRFPAGTATQADETAIFKTIELLPETYRLNVSIRIENQSTKSKDITVGLWGPIGITNDGSDTAAEHSRVALYGSTDSQNWSDLEESPQLKGFTSSFNDTLAEMQEDNGHENSFLTNLEYDEIDENDRFLIAHGLRTQYFLAFLASNPDEPDSGWIGHVRTAGKGSKARAAVSMIAPELNIDAKSDATVSMSLYIGPRDKDTLEAAWDASKPENEEMDALWTGLATSGFWDFFAAPLVILLHGLTGLVGPGLAIIFLTLIVRFALSPLSYRGQKNMAIYTQKMKVVKPRLDAVKEKYKDKKDRDTQLKMLTETREIMKSEGVGFVPIAGCMPMFLQLPIFIGLYRAFGNSFFLRQESFLWIGDLTLPDASIGVVTQASGLFGMLAHNGYLTLNILPILWIVLSIMQFKMQPKPDDPQQAAMQKQMGCMFPIMGLFFYGFASGFAFYFIISSIYSMGESRLIKYNLRKAGVMPDPKKEVKVDANDKPEYHAS
ncbi:YidC/Oxa1 family insertase periplasmic-domain containing protein [Planctomycetota bacterium]|nr:YidC/Oxa1 family insertase periplasmic-domain containing protein [Planctomycetota bacterium]